VRMKLSSASPRRGGRMNQKNGVVSAGRACQARCRVVGSAGAVRAAVLRDTRVV